ncbi:MAG: hypothetical protein ACI9IT_001175 [Glaciecola sp.]|jgi:hypothetical protein
MSDEKFVDPRLQAKEAIFQQLHLSTFDTMGYAHAVIQEVNESGKDIAEDNDNYQQLLRDYQVTRNIAPIADSPLALLCKQTDGYIKNSNQAHASISQLCAAATNTLNHWRILAEIPDDLLDIKEVSSQQKENYASHLAAWRQVLGEFEHTNKTDNG